MACLAEALGMVPLGQGSIPAVHADRLRAAEEAGALAMRLIANPIKPSQIMTAHAVENALRVLLALGGSTNALIHLTAIAGRLGVRVELLFLDSTDEALTRRFSETRRRHPLAPEGSVQEGIRLEREALADLRELADQVIDTSPLNVHDLKRTVQSRFAAESTAGPAISVMSFGYRYGVPSQADLVLDARFLPNPYFVPELKGLTGRNPAVADFVLHQPDAITFLAKVEDLCRYLFPRYQKEGKAYLTVALGCTGGKHRSVALARELAKRLGADARVQVWDRDIEKE